MLFSCLHDIPYFQLDRYPNAKSINDWVSEEWKSTSTEHFIRNIEKLAFGLLQRGIQKGDHIAIMSDYGSANWFTIDLACMSIGAVVVPIYPNYTSEELSYIFNQLDVQILFCQDDNTVGILPNINLTTDNIFCISAGQKQTSWEKLFAEEKDYELLRKQKYERNQLIQDEDLATIIYTSGSTGQPKGVMLSHRNIVSNIKAIITLIPITYKHVVASYLPLNHIFERMVVYTYMSVGAQIHFIQDPKNLLKQVQEIKPHYMSSVPRILEKLYNHIIIQSKQAKPIQKRLIQMAKNMTQKQYVAWYGIPFWWIKTIIADAVVYRRWREALGGRIKGIVVGAAALNPEIARLYSKAGIPIKEGYGLTETSPVITFNRFEPGGTRFGTVGIPIPGVEVKIEQEGDNDSGEILVRGPNVMMGYYKNEELTKEKIDSEGWFHTGDIGIIVKKRFIQITDRKKNIFKTSSGRYIYPQKIEESLRSRMEVDQCMIVGFQRAYISALIIPDFEYLEEWCIKHQVHWTAPLYMVINDRVIQHYEDMIYELNKSLQAHEKIKKFTLLSEAWTVISGEYTPTLKIRRKTVLEKFDKEIQAMYS